MLHIALVTSPIKKTNVILKNVNFQYAVKLWNYIQEHINDDSSVSTKSNESYDDTGVLKNYFDESFLLDYLVSQTIIHGNTKKLDKQEFLNPNIEQIFIFTHNFYFYREVSFDKRPINTSWCHHIIEKNNSVSKVTYSGHDCTIKNDYSMMWENLKRAKATLGADKTQNIMLANTMRRVIDTYLDFVGIKKSSKPITWSALETVAEGSPEYIVKSAFISFINDDSHGVAAMDDIYYDSIVKQDPSVIFSAFKALFKDIGESHYEYMMDETY